MIKRNSYIYNTKNCFPTPTIVVTKAPPLNQWSMQLKGLQVMSNNEWNSWAQILFAHWQLEHKKPLPKKNKNLHQWGLGIRCETILNSYLKFKQQTEIIGQFLREPSFWMCDPFTDKMGEKCTYR